MTASTSLYPLQKEKFSLHPSFDGGSILIRLTGQGDMTTTLALAQFLGLVHDEALRLHVREVVVDMKELTFLNSSCLKSFVTWIDKAAQLEVPQRYGIRFQSNAKHSWQRRSLNALRLMSNGVATVES